MMSVALCQCSVMAAYHHNDRHSSARRPSSRPRSLYAAQGSSYMKGASSSPYLNNSSPYSSSTFSLPSSFQSQSPYSTYGGTSSGYGGLTLPSSSSYNLSTSPKMTASSSYLNNLLHSSNYGSRTGSPTYSSTRTASPTYSHRPSANRSSSDSHRSTANRTNNFNRHHALPSVRSSLGQRSSSSLSLKSDTSEGYVSGGDRSSRSSRFSSSTEGESTSNGEIDYKKLYEESQLDNERLREKLRKTEDDLKESKAHSEKNASPGKNSMSELEKRERRAMERKLSEMEEELKQLQKLKAENERLRAENRALTRVVSKLTASANAAK